MPKSIEKEINDFLQIWDCNQQISFLRDIAPLFKLYDVNDEDDWVKKEVGQLDERNVRLIRTVYLVSKIAENHSGRLANIRARFKGIINRMKENSYN